MPDRRLPIGQKKIHSVPSVPVVNIRSEKARIMEDLEKQHRKNESFVFRKIENETILVPIKDNVGDMDSIYNLNELGAFVWEHLDGEKRLIDIKDLILKEFDVSSEEAEKDLLEFVGELEAIDAVFAVE